ncbi:hypothetical protein [Cellulomonas sp. ATA003]|uniref:hypothetical protein n=1 Tax=Cellulomonas sp. ATA003 TaxID=3073064 RepID=UPI002873BF83|nr:hypothetical protein [Cellulomonas sp. ATA003]WNB84448.1 hypothetical protein REH70_11365 [Cellulomonas sp. ATA003]
MSDPILPRTDAARGDVPAGERGAHLTMSPTGPQRPEAGSALERLLSRQTFASASGGLLGFVPAQVR